MEKVKKKISFFVNLSEKFEGRTKIVLLLKKALEKKGYKVVFNDMDADLIHVHSSGIAPSFLIKKFKKKNVKTVFSLYSTCESNPLSLFRSFVSDIPFYTGHVPMFELIKTLLLYLISTLIPLRIKGHYLKKFDKVIVPSNCIKEKLSSNTELIHLGIDINKFKPTKKDSKKKNLIVGYVGHFSDFKGVHEVIKASKKFSSDIETHFHFHTFGKGVKLKKLKNIVHRENKNAIVFGKSKDISKVYNNIDILVYPLKMPVSAIANPLVLLEAMACGCAIVTTKIQNIKEIVKNSVITINSDPEEIINAVNRLKDVRLRERLGKQAREIIEREYNEDVMISKYLTIYKKLVGGPYSK